MSSWLAMGMFLRGKVGRWSLDAMRGPLPRLFSHGRFSGLQESLETLDLLFHWYAFGVHLSREVYVPRIRSIPSIREFARI